MQIIIGNELLTFGFTEIKVENLENGKKETKKIKRSNFESSKKAKVNEYSYYEDYYESGGKDYKYFFKMVHNSYGNYLNTACTSITHYKKSWGFYWQHDTYWMNINANYVGGGCYGSSLPYYISVIEEDFICSNIEIDLLTGSAQCAANVDVYFTLTIKTGGIINWNWSS